MEKRKNPEVDPERQRIMFVVVGLVISLSLGLLAFEWRTFETKISEIVTDIPDEEIEEKIIDIQLSTPPPPPPPPPSMAEIVEIVENDVVIENEIKVENTQVDENTEVTHTDFTGTEETVTEDNTVYDAAALQDTPIFPGCEDAKTSEERNKCFQEKIIGYIGANFKYPEDAKEMNYQGKVMVQFVIEKDGSINGAVVLKGVYASLDKEAIRVINSLPKITPARQAGRPVRVRYVVPIVCRIQ